MGAFRNIIPGFGRQRTASRRTNWIGICCSVPPQSGRYNPNRAIYHFRWFWDYSGGQMTNLGHHALDIVHWCLDANPTAVTSAGGRFCLNDNGETPDTQDALIEYPGFTAVWSHREGSQGRPASHGLEFFGTKGSMTHDRAMVSR